MDDIHGVCGFSAPVADDMATMNQNLLNVVGERHPMLKAAAEQIFGAGGKKLRPMLIFLVSHATAELGGLKYVPSLSCIPFWMLFKSWEDKSCHVQMFDHFF